MRIIAGTARGRRLEALKGEDTRPTLDRVKEGIFSAVQFWLPGAAVLDLFAGSGQLGLEAISRGAKCCTFVDSAPAAVELIRQNARSLGFEARCRVRRGEAAAFLAGEHEKYDLILMDPPYRQGWPEKLLPLAAAVCAPGALLLCESEPGAALPETADGLALEKQYRYGTVLVSRYKMGDACDGPGDEE